MVLEVAPGPLAPARGIATTLNPLVNPYPAPDAMSYRDPARTVNRRDS